MTFFYLAKHPQSIPCRSAGIRYNSGKPDIFICPSYFRHINMVCVTIFVRVIKESSVEIATHFEYSAAVESIGVIANIALGLVSVVGNICNTTRSVLKYFTCPDHPVVTFTVGMMAWVGK